MTNIVAIAVLGCALLAGSVQAQQKQSNMRLVAKNQTANLIYQTDRPEVIRVQISDAQGMILLTSRIETDGSFMRPYSLAELPPGIYYFSVKDSKGTYKQVFSTLEPKREDASIQLRKTGTANQLELVVKRHDHAPLHISLLNEEGDSLHEEDIKDQMSFRKLFSLQKIEGQEVLVRISGKEGYLYAERFQF